MCIVRRALVVIATALVATAAAAPAQHASGIVLGFDGEPVQGAVVLGATLRDARWCREVLTTADGCFEFDCAAPLQQLRVQVEGVFVDVPLVNGSASAAQVSFVGAPHFTLRGAVVAPDGAPAPQVEVLCRDRRGSAVVSVATDAHGRFAVRLGAPVHALEVDPIGWQHVQDGPFDRDREVTVDLRAEGDRFFALQGRVIADDGPNAGATVVARGDGGRRITTQTRADGLYTLWANYRVTALEVPGVLAIVRKGPFVSAATAVDLDFREHGCVLVTGRFVTADGRPIPGALVFALDHAGKPGRNVPANGATDSGGWFVLRLPRGTPFLYVVEDGAGHGGGSHGSVRVPFDGRVVLVRARD